MRIATLQFAPSVGDVENNIQKADKILQSAAREGRLEMIDLLVLPEMAFSGYNHPSLDAIMPYLEPTLEGVTTKWARETARWLNCIVAVGYPERTVQDQDGSVTDFEASYYNALVFVSPMGEVIAHYRKTFLYYTDETWAAENPDGFHSGDLPISVLSDGDHQSVPGATVINGKQPATRIAAGICMDINPHMFQAPWDAYEFANHCLESRAKLVVLSMAWLTRLSAEDVEEQSAAPDIATIGYWIERFKPLHTARARSVDEGDWDDDLTHDRQQEERLEKDLDTAGGEEEVIVVFANRCGEEGTAPLIGDVRYAGSSCVMGMTRSQGHGTINGTVDDGSNVRIWDILGRGAEDVLVVDTREEAKYVMRMKNGDNTRDGNEDEEYEGDE